jgi:AcrR family transcriptional regulator
MARVAKAPEVRRNELIDCAQALFFSVGYDATTVADIIARAGISKGGFYHHFDSKEALLEAFSTRMIQEVLAGAQDILEAADLTPLERLNAFFQHAQSWKAQSGPQLLAAFEAVLKLENDVLYQRVARAASRVMRPVFERLIDEGARSGQFDPPDAAITAEIVLSLALSRQRTVAEAMVELAHGDIAASTRRLEARLQAEELVIDRLLGLPPGSVRLIEPGFVRTVLEAMRAPV